MTLRVGVASVVTGLALAAFGAAPALACSCAEQTTEQAAQGAALVVQGTVASVEQPSDATGVIGYELDVSRVLKGTGQRHMVVESAASGASCGIEGIEQGDEVVVFADQQAGNWVTGLCDGTAKVSPELVKEVEATLGQGEAPTDDARPGSANLFLSAAVGAVVAALVAAVVLLRQRRRG